MRFIFILAALFALSVPALASQNQPLVFDGEQFRSRFKATTNGGDKLREFVRKSETIHNWTKLVAFRYQHMPGIGNDPSKAAAEMARVVKGSNPRAGYSILRGKREAMLDFVTWPKHRKYVEFSVVRYAKSADGNGVVSVKFGYRFTDTTPDGIKKFKRQRQAWMQKIARFDLGRVQTSLAD